MYLKKIEIQGFKSFANKIELDFHSGITSIVGPNGSGKSNIADAVRWVLGEQRVKQLRGANMQDVIFAGTESRRPLSYATVAITLDNSDHALPIEYEELTVTRRLYRSGESEYLLNGTPCRLKDVNEMFYDTGIGKEGYSIIGQGQIDRIISGKPEERRELFDEAVGIVKFKRRKAQTQKKLEDERNNLTRVTDILGELEKQLAPLEEDSVKAKAYLRLKEYLKKYDINLFLVEIRRLKSLMDELDEKISLVSDEHEEAKRTYEETKEKYHAIEEELELIDDEVSEAHDQLNKTSMLEQQLRGEIQVLEAQIEASLASDEHVRQRSEALSKDITERENSFEELEKERTDLESRLEDLNEALKLRAARDDSLASDLAEITAQIEEANASILAFVQGRANDTAEKERCDALIERNKAREEELTVKISDSDEDVRQLDAIIDEAGARLASIEEEEKSAKDAIANCEKELASLQEKLSVDNASLKEQESALNREMTRLDYMRNIAERYEGYGSSTRRVMECKDTVSGLIGVVADIIKTESRYETAIETALGAGIQHIVVDTEDTAKQMIAYLKENKYGRATFLPLSSTNQTRSFEHPEVLKKKGVIGLASDLVKADDRFSGIVAYLLGRTVVADHIDHAIALEKEYKYRLRIVTLDGESLSPGGSITGGAYKHSGNLLGRNRELEQLEKTVEKLRTAFQKQHVLVEDEKAKRSSLHQEIDAQHEKLHELSLASNTEILSRDAAQRRKDEYDLSVQTKQQEISSIHEQNEALGETIRQIDERLATSDSDQKEAGELVKKLSEDLESGQKELESFREESEKLRTEHATLSQRFDFLTKDLERIDSELERFREEMTSLISTKDAASRDVTEKRERIEALTQTITESKELYDEINENIRAAKEKKEELNRRHRRFIDQREELSAKVAELDKEHFRLQNRKDNAETSLDEQITYMWQEYEITPILAEKLRDESLTNLNEIKKHINAVRGEIKELGDVNVGSIERFKEVSERCRFLTEQRDDLIEAEEKLLGIIEELDTGMRRQFEKRFADIKKEFDKVFRQLFGGGTGTLELVPGEDVLEAGISIIAQPPGKKLQNMMQLSGGEKALTAIALLFAIQNMKPSPFCLLDEIEAALDDANVTRFADYLKLLTEHTQFIMITHRRGTMAVSDRLYGITMQEKGVSALVSVDLVESSTK